MQGRPSAFCLGLGIASTNLGRTGPILLRDQSDCVLHPGSDRETLRRRGMRDDAGPRFVKDAVGHRRSHQTASVGFAEPARTSNVIVCSFEVETFCNLEPVDDV